MNFIPETPVLLAYVAGVVVITLTPGPDMTFFIGRAIAQNVHAGLAAFGGALVGIVFHSLFVAFGLSALIVASPALFTAVKIAGAAYLGWLAFDAIRHGSTFQISEKSQNPRSMFSNWFQGLAINLLNPKIIIFFMTFLPQFVSTADPYASGKLLFLGTLFVLIAMVILVPLIALAGQFAAWMKENPKVTRIVDYLFAGIFGAFAVRILFTERG
ncbi:LysE family translocator [Salaquimonas pukyongi]|uniref:LysE family translocator n=1 Tax=Salaquimonas pukyongi TaxID=2712698 RepID=UPI00096B8B68|nr:LysE family translocator [Salaquimonas pukyongi]